MIKSDCKSENIECKFQNMAAHFISETINKWMRHFQLKIHATLFQSDNLRFHYHTNCCGLLSSHASTYKLQHFTYDFTSLLRNLLKSCVLLQVYEVIFFFSFKVIS